MAQDKFAVLGLGHFGLNLCLHLTNLGSEVLGIDQREERVELLRDRISHAMVLDTTDPRALAQIGLNDFDAVIVAIGENFEASILTTAYLQEQKVNRIINRVVSPVHERLLKLMNITELILPEGEAASHLARRLTIKGVTESLEVSGDYAVIEAHVPQWAVGKSLTEVDLRRRYKLNLVTIMREVENTGLMTLGRKENKQILGIPEADMVFSAEDILLLFGKESDIRRFLKA